MEERYAVGRTNDAFNLCVMNLGAEIEEAPAHVRRLLFAIAALVAVGCSMELVSWTVLPEATHDLGGDTLYGLVNTVVPLGAVGALVYAGVVLDHRGCRTVARWGVLATLIGTLVIMAAPSTYLLAVGRFISGVGNGFTTAAALAAVSTSLPRSLRPKALALMTGVWFPSAVVFPQVASLVRDLTNWRASYGVALVVGLLALIMSVELPKRHPHVEGDVPLVGSAAIVVVLGVGMFVVATNVAMPVLWAFGLAVVSIGITVSQLRRILPEGTFSARPGLPAAITMKGLWGFSILSLQAFETFALVRVLDAPGWVVGAALASVEAGVGVGAWILTRVHDKHPLHTLLRYGASVGALGAIGFGLVIVFELPALVALVPMFIRHIGWGIGHNACSEAVTLLAPIERRGRLTASSNVAMCLGFTLGPAVAGIAFANADSVPGDVRGAIAAATAVSVVGFAVVIAVAGRIHAEQRP